MGCVGLTLACHLPTAACQLVLTIADSHSQLSHQHQHHRSLARRLQCMHDGCSHLVSLALPSRQTGRRATGTRGQHDQAVTSMHAYCPECDRKVPDCSQALLNLPSLFICSKHLCVRPPPGCMLPHRASLSAKHSAVTLGMAADAVCGALPRTREAPACLACGSGLLFSSAAGT